MPKDGLLKRVEKAPETAWIYYRLFIEEPKNFNQLIALLNEVVTPVIEQFGDNIFHFHFFFYRGEYQDHLEGDEGVHERLAGIGDADWVCFIRLRIQVMAEYEQAVRDQILSLANRSTVVRGYERPVTPYDPANDLGSRFGVTRTHQVMKLLEAAAHLALSFAKGEEPINPDSNGQGGPAGLVHLVANSIRFNIFPTAETNLVFDVWDLQRQVICPPYTLML